MYECGSYRRVVIAALILLLACVPLRFRGSRGVDEAKLDQEARDREAERAVEQAARDAEALVRDLEVRCRYTRAVLHAREVDHPDKWCPGMPKAAAEKAVRGGGVHISHECLDSPLAKGCG